MCKYNKNQVSPYDQTNIEIHSIWRPEDDLISNCGKHFRKNGFLPWHCAFHWWGEHRCLCIVGLRYYFLPWHSDKKSDRSTENRFSFPEPLKNASAFPVTTNINCIIVEHHSSNNCLNPYNLWDQIQAALLPPNHTNDRDILCPISTLNQQLTILEQTHIRCSLVCERWRVEIGDWTSALHSFKKTTYPTVEWTKQLLLLKSWVISEIPEHWMETHCLWWAVIVITCSNLFHSFDLYWLLVQNLLLFFWNFFSSLSLMTLDEK